MPGSRSWWPEVPKAVGTARPGSLPCPCWWGCSTQSPSRCWLAGGISSPRGLAAVLAAGASGVWLGTAFAACPESLASDAARRALLEASERDTVTTKVFDAALGYPWPPEYPERVLSNWFTRRWSGREEELISNSEAHAALAAAISDDDFTIAPVNAGQGVGLLTEIRHANEVVELFCAGAAELLRSRHP
jgi:nitronate monooxygenase